VVPPEVVAFAKGPIGLAPVILNVRLLNTVPTFVRPKFNPGSPDGKVNADDWQILLGAAKQEEVTVKFTFETSKNLTHEKQLLSTLILAVVLLGTFEGMVSVSVPSFEVADAKVKGYELPPSIDSKIFTVPQMDDELLPDHVTVWLLPAAQVTAVFGAVTANGPTDALTTKVIWLQWIPPPAALLSLTDSLKFKFLAAVGKHSPTFAGGLLELFKMYSRLGKDLFGEEEGSYTLKIGPEVLPHAAPAPPCGGPASNCSQL
jgi:hypothetical protein